MTPSHKRIETDDAGIHVVDWRTSTAPHSTLLCIHGVTANARSFDGIAQGLLPGVRSIAVDLAGRGESDDPTSGFGIPVHVENMVAVLDAMDLSAVAVAGWSLGSMIAIHLAASHPSRVERLVLLDPPLGPLNDLTVRSLGRGWKRLERTYPDMDAAIAAWRESPALPATWNDAVEAYVRADLRQLEDGTVAHRIDPRVPGLEREAAVPPLTSVIPNVDCPTLILRATDPLFVAGDELLTADSAERVRKLFPNAELIDVPGTNHYTITVGEPSGTIAAMRSFLA